MEVRKDMKLTLKPSASVKQLKIHKNPSSLPAQKKMGMPNMLRMIAGSPVPSTIGNWTLPPILQAVRDGFPPGSEWLWKRCNEVLDPDDPCSMDMELRERARVLSLVLDNPRRGALTPYPLRPPGSLVSSESVGKLRAILAQVPRVLKDGNGEDEIVGLV